MVNGSDRYKKGSLAPFLSLGDAIEVVDKVYEQGGGRANYALLSRIFDNSPSSSSFTKKLACLKSFGLVTEPLKGEVSLSDLGMTIAAPQSPEAGAIAKKDAFLRIEVYNKIFERHKGKLLPADEFLKNIVEQDCGIPRSLSDSWVASFKDAIRVAGLVYDRGDQKKQILESAVIERSSTSPTASVERNDQANSVSHSVDAFVRVPASEPSSGSGVNVNIGLSRGQVAIFRIPDRLTSKDVQKLKGTLEGFTSMIDSLIGDEE